MKKEIVFIDEKTLTPEEMAAELGMTKEEFENYLKQFDETEDDNEQQTEK